ncbi:DNA repair protein RecO [Rhodohalobacter barkolensis]|uniref:DNA repair protein RecO n=1 Tax=Rhodohalobacter barkolensis TaxID=2053187 RepID=A0A2N0VLP6_9BACT|nr:DNA repair protein RecO [Rhodohalobacter barkolensis]PKD45079.1 DNA repair protein RecO [Rhodohalobacter barkolensis]
MITKTEAIVLRTVEYQESSIIATLFTHKHGKIAVIAKGARKPKSKFSAFLVPGQMLEVVYYMKQTRQVQTLSDVSYLKKLDNIRLDLQKMALATITLELTSQLLHDNEVNEPLFQFLSVMLPWINKQDEVSRIMFPYIQIRLAQLLGIGIQNVIEEHDSVNMGYINIESGTLSSQPVESEAVKLTPKQFHFVRESLKSMKSSIFDIDLSTNELKSLIDYLDKYFRYHIEGVKPRKSDAIFEQLLAD